MRCDIKLKTLQFHQSAYLCELNRGVLINKIMPGSFNLTVPSSISISPSEIVNEGLKIIRQRIQAFLLGFQDEGVVRPSPSRIQALHYYKERFLDQRSHRTPQPPRKGKRRFRRFNRANKTGGTPLKCRSVENY